MNGPYYWRQYGYKTPLPVIIQALGDPQSVDHLCYSCGLKEGVYQHRYNLGNLENVQIWFECEDCNSAHPAYDQWNTMKINRVVELHSGLVKE
jgi:hypothetical protein